MLETREVSGFKAVRVHGVGELNITQGEREALTIESDEHVLPLIESTVEGGTLTLGPKNGKRIRKLKRLIYTLTVTDLEAITLDGEGNTTITNLNVEALTVNLRGAGNFTISGAAPSQTINLQGAGSYDARAFATSRTSVGIKGAGDVVVQAGEALDINVSGVGNVTYYGTPAITQKISGIGKIQHGG